MCQCSAHCPLSLSAHDNITTAHYISPQITLTQNHFPLGGAKCKVLPLYIIPLQCFDRLDESKGYSCEGFGLT